MSCADCKLCGLIRRKKSVRKERVSPKESKGNSYENEKLSVCKSSFEKYEDSSSSSSCSSPVNHSRGHTDPTHILRRRPKSPNNLAPSKLWPPTGYSNSQNLSPIKAKNLISSGAPLFHGHKLPITLSGKERYNLFATISLNGALISDGREDKTFKAASLRLQGSGAPKYPWETLEQPSVAFYYGYIPGTVRLNYWTNMSSRLDKCPRKFDKHAKPRDLTINAIIERLVDFDIRINENDNDLSGRDIHKDLLRISELIVGPQKTIDFQIRDLVHVLSRHSWIDFSKKKNHVVANFFVNATYADEGRHKLFFHQILLALELDLRIQRYSEEAKLEFFKHIPEKVKWDIALARVWRHNVKIERARASGPDERIRFHLRKKKEQLNNLYEFAKTLKWPTLSSLAPVFLGPSEEVMNYSSDVMSYLTAVILPGPSLTYLLMNTLIDIDPSSSSNLRALEHQFPNTGFQYRGSTYWTSNCIVGKVLAPTCKEICGWIGPARPATGLNRTQVARIRQRKPKRRLEEEDVESMSERSMPLGPIAEKYPIKDYVLLDTDINQNSLIDDIKIEKLSLWPTSSSTRIDKFNPLTFDVSVQFAFNGTSWPLTLKYDATFLCACACKDGPHPLFYDYEHKIVQVSDILHINDWAEQSRGPVNFNPKSHTGSDVEKIILENVGSQLTGPQTVSGTSRATGYYDEKVLVIEAYGVTDNEVLARAWCAHWGLNALVADTRFTCKACAIRESFAACINVLILIDKSLNCHKDDA